MTIRDLSAVFASGTRLLVSCSTVRSNGHTTHINVLHNGTLRNLKDPAVLDREIKIIVNQSGTVLDEQKPFLNVTVY